MTFPCIICLVSETRVFDFLSASNFTYCHRGDNTGFCYIFFRYAVCHIDCMARLSHCLMTHVPIDLL